MRTLELLCPNTEFSCPLTLSHYDLYTNTLCKGSSGWFSPLYPDLTYVQGKIESCSVSAQRGHVFKAYLWIRTVAIIFHYISDRQTDPEVWGGVVKPQKPLSGVERCI
jgi:hypothetical protein